MTSSSEANLDACRIKLAKREQQSRESAALSLFRAGVKTFIAAHCVFVVSGSLFDPQADKLPVPDEFRYIALILAGLIVGSMCIRKVFRVLASVTSFLSLVGYATLLLWLAVHFQSLAYGLFYGSYAGLALVTAATCYYLDVQK